jgi:predicted hydrolase (HD superfamily)
LSDLTVENVLKRFRERSFARGTRREDIELCKEKLGMTLEELVGVGLKAMQGVSKDLGL